MKLWRLKNISTGEFLTEPQVLPKNWGPIFGMEGFKDKLGDLSWVGKPDLGWVEVEIDDNEILRKQQKELVDLQVDTFLKDSLNYVAADNTSVTKQQRAEWIEYRQKLKEIYLQPDYPLNVNWPKKPE